jgi:futalosine hydrolase
VEILIVAATPHETELLRKVAGFSAADQQMKSSVDYHGNQLTLLHTGIGMVNTAYHLGRYLLGHSPDLALQVGIAGSFADGPGLGEVVEVTQECYADLGADSPEGFLDLKTMGFENFRLGSELYFNEIANPHGKRTHLRACRGITVNNVHGRQLEIDAAVQKWRPEVESMEGAAFFQCCLLESVPFLQLRGISNHVEPRNRASWKIREAAEAVQKFCQEFLKDPASNKQ